MESDDDYQSFSPPSDSSSPSLHQPKLKRLKKKSVKVSADPSQAKSNRDESIPFTAVDFAKLEALESSKTISFDDSEDQLTSQSPDGFLDEEGRRGVDFEEVYIDDVVSEDLGEKIADMKIDKSEKKRSSEGGSSDKKKKTKGVLPLPRVDFAKLEALDSSKTPALDDSDDSLLSQSPSESLDDETSNVDGVPRVAKRVLNFDDEIGGDGVDGGDKKEDKISVIKSEKKRTSEGENKEKKVKTKKIKSSSVEEDKTSVSKSEKKRNSEGENKEKKAKTKKIKSSSAEAKLREKPSNKKREEKERRDYLEQLHAESQRLLRETSGAGFKPVHIVHKPISSILEKIRQRKLEMSKKMRLLNNSDYTTENDDSLIEAMVDTDSDKVSTRGGGKDNLLDKVEMEANINSSFENIESSPDTSLTDGVKGLRTHSSHENDNSPMTVFEEPNPTFRAPVDDTQDLFGDSETSDNKDDHLNNQHSSPLEEVLAPSLLTMNLKIDSVPLDDDDVSSDEEDNDKENLVPITHKSGGARSSPKGDPVKAFVDDEAEEEDDSDHDLRFRENDEDEGNEDLEELNDLIVTGYEEKSIDNERRNELHQKWLEQQDAAGTDNLMQRLRCGPKANENTLSDMEVESDEDDEGFSDDEQDVGPAKTARINTRKAKQMIPQMFADKEDPFVSSDDEETEKRLVKQRVLDKAGDQVTLISPAEDENSREVFGLIKKLNNAPVVRKKQKAPSFLDTLITGGSSSSSSSKSSFLGRVSNHSLPSKQRCSTTRSYIFGRDDSNSRSSISISEDSSDAVAKEVRPTQKVTAKYISSQGKSISQSSQIVAETTYGTSLIEILKRSSMQSNSCNQDHTIGLTQTVFSAFKIPKKSIKVEGKPKY